MKVSYRPSSTVHRPSSFSIPGFTLVELLVVIAIIGVLAGVLLSTFSGGSEAARAARCLSNMKNLASACQTYGMANGRYPLAGNRVRLEIDESGGAKNIQRKYTEIPGWISTKTEGYFPSTSYRQGAPISIYSDDERESTYALTNGAIWRYVSGNRQTYVCPVHARKCAKTTPPNWSYLMSARFGWDSSGKASTGWCGAIGYGTLAKADRVLLFSEVPFAGHNTWQPDGTAGTQDTDAILQYAASGSSASGAKAGSGGNEQLGVNHCKGKSAYTHVAFADGHVEKLRVPMKGKKPDTTQMAQLATWLAVGQDVSFNGTGYQKVEN